MSMTMFDHTRIAQDFSKAAPRYAAAAKLQEEIGKHLMEVASPLLTPDALLLDVGSGSGEMTQRWPCKRKLSVDIAFGMCREAKSRGGVVINGTAERLPIASHTADMVASNLMLQWLSQPELFFAESFRVLKKGGVLAVSTFVQGTLAELEAAFAKAGQQGRVSRFLSAAEWVQHVKNAGFELQLCEEKIMRETTPDVMTLCRHLRAIGAHNKRTDRPRGMLTPRMMHRVEEAYGDEGIASWVVQYMVARKIR